MTRIYIITEVRSYRDALEQALGRSGRVEVVGSAAHPVEAAGEIEALHPEVVLLDSAGPLGPQWAGELRSIVPDAGVIALGLGEAEHEVIAWAEAGVAGYLGREASLDELLSAIEGATRGEAACSPHAAAILLRRIAVGPSAPVPAWQRERHLTAREREILNLVGQGLSNQQIAGRLFLALSTVKNHVHNILEKLEVHRRIDAVREIRRAGFVSRRDPAATYSERPALELIKA
jgi:two-component system nitrate/nitrite response regulator NarL